MAHYRHLPIWKAALDLAVLLEHAVRRFSRYNKYTLGADLRQIARRLCAPSRLTKLSTQGFVALAPKEF